MDILKPIIRNGVVNYKFLIKINKRKLILHIGSGISYFIYKNYIINKKRISGIKNIKIFLTSLFTDFIDDTNQDMNFKTAIQGFKNFLINKELPQKIIDIMKPENEKEQSNNFPKLLNNMKNKYFIDVQHQNNDLLINENEQINNLPKLQNKNISDLSVDLLKKHKRNKNIIVDKVSIKKLNMILQSIQNETKNPANVLTSDNVVTSEIKFSLKDVTISRKISNSEKSKLINYKKSNTENCGKYKLKNSDRSNSIICGKSNSINSKNSKPINSWKTKSKNSEKFRTKKFGKFKPENYEKSKLIKNKDILSLSVDPLKKHKRNKNIIVDKIGIKKLNTILQSIQNETKKIANVPTPDNVATSEINFNLKDVILSKNILKLEKLKLINYKKSNPENCGEYKLKNFDRSNSITCGKSSSTNSRNSKPINSLKTKPENSEKFRAKNLGKFKSENSVKYKPVNYEKSKLINSGGPDSTNCGKSNQINSVKCKPENYDKFKSINSGETKPENYEKFKLINSGATKPENYEKSKTINSDAPDPTNCGKSNPINSMKCKPENYEKFKSINSGETKPENYEMSKLINSDSPDLTNCGKSNLINSGKSKLVKP